MRLKLMWLGLSFLLLICVLALPSGYEEAHTSVFGLLCYRFEHIHLSNNRGGAAALVSLLSLLCLGVGALFFGMRCLLGKMELKTGWAIAIGLPCTAFGLGVFLLFGLYALIFGFLLIHGMPGP